MCNTLLCSRIDETVEIQGRTPHPEIEEHDHGVGEYLANQAMLIMPEVVRSGARYSKMLRQMRSNGFEQFSPPSTGF